jgi:hypothetical protein
MPVERAMTAYQKERLNCAQSVMKGFQVQKNLPDQELQAAARLGGGRAENGVCGALHVALALAADPAVREKVRNDFMAAAGSEKCRDIRSAGQVPCAECVRLAASLLVRHEGGGNPA